MKALKFIVLTFFTLMFLILIFISNVFAFERQITTDPSSQTNPFIYADKIVYEDSRNGNYDIYMYNFTTNTETQITTHSADQLYPSMYNDKIVWMDLRNGNSDIYMYNISTSTEIQITTNAAIQRKPSIYGNNIVYVDYRNTSADIYSYNLSTGIETRLTTDSSIQDNPVIYGDKVVYDDFRNGNWDIYMYNLSTSTETRITTNSANQQNPSIYNNKIVWQDSRNGNLDIYMYNISTSTESQITTNSSSQYLPFIYNDKVVYDDFRNGNSDIYMYNLSTSTESQITTETSAQGNPAIFNSNIVWDDARNGNNDIYMAYNNQGPALTPIGNKTVDEGSVLTFVVNASDFDNDNLTYSASNLPSGSTFNPLTRTFFWTPGYNQSGVYPNVHFEVTDGNGGIDSEDITITVNDYSDTTPPTTTLNINPSAPGGDNGWYKIFPQVTLIPNESAVTEYQWDSTSGPWTIYLGGFFAQEGDHTLYYRSTDIANNVEANKSLQIKVDTSLPTDPSLNSPSHTINVWSNNNNVTVSLSGAADSISGVDGFAAAWNQSPTYTVNQVKSYEETTTSITGNSLAQGDMYFHLRTKDNAGNWTPTIHYGPFKLDIESPSVPTLSGSAISSTELSLSWTASSDNYGVLGYKIYDTSNNEVASSSLTSYTFSGLNPNSPGSVTTSTGTDVSVSMGATYSYYIKAYDSANNMSSNSNIETVTLNNNVSLNFENVTSPGTTSYNLTQNSPYPVKNGYKFLNKHYEITTTANFSGNITVTLPYDPSAVTGSEDELKLFHWESNEWVDVTTAVDTSNNKITGMVTSLSPFEQGEPNGSGGGQGGDPPSSVGYSNSWLIITIITLLTAGGYLLLRHREEFVRKY